MASKPILFSTPMVQAILDGRKTQTRRVVKINDCPITSPKESLELTKEGLIYHSICSMSGYYKLLCQPGDILWVRETWATVSSGIIEYKATYIEPYTGSTEIDHIGKKITWRPSIYMPREAARIFLRVTNVRVERVQDITENDADWEGVGKCPYEHRVYGAYGYGHDSMCWAEGDCRNPDKACSKSLREHFCEYWNSLNAKRGLGWDTNPWVWVIEFKVVKP